MNLLETILSQFNMGTITSITPIEAGFLTENKLVETENGRYFLKGHRDEVSGHIGYVEGVEQFFARGGIPVIVPIQTKEGKLHFIHEAKTYTLYPIVTGIQPKREELNHVQLKNLGENLARMHLLSKNGIPEELKEQEINHWNKEKTLEKFKQAEAFIQKKDLIDDTDKMTLDHIALKRSFIQQNTMDYGDFNLENDTLTHGDYHEQNVFFDEQGCIKHTFDFEMAKIGPRYGELVRSLMFTCFNEHFNDDNFEKAECYLKGYCALYPTEMRTFESALEAFRIKSFHSAWIEGEYYLKANTKVKVFIAQQFSRNLYFSTHFEEFKRRILGFIA